MKMQPNPFRVGPIARALLPSSWIRILDEQADEFDADAEYEEIDPPRGLHITQSPHTPPPLRQANERYSSDVGAGQSFWINEIRVVSAQRGGPTKIYVLVGPVEGKGEVTEGWYYCETNPDVMPAFEFIAQALHTREYAYWFRKAPEE